MAFAVVCEVKRRKRRGVGEGMGKGVVTPVGSVTTSAESSMPPPRDGARRPSP